MTSTKMFLFLICVTFVFFCQAQFPPVLKTFDGWGRQQVGSSQFNRQPPDGQFPPPPSDDWPPPPDGRPPPIDGRFPPPDGRPPPPFPGSNGELGQPSNKWETGPFNQQQNGGGFQPNGGGQLNGGGFLLNGGVQPDSGNGMGPPPMDGRRPCMADQNSPMLPDCIQKYIKNDMLIDGNSNKCSTKAETPAKLNVTTLLSKAEQLMKSGQCQGEQRGPPPGGRGKRQPRFGSCGSGPGVGNCEKTSTRLQSIYAEKDMGDSILIVTNGVPDHCYHDGMDIPNPNSVCEHYRAVLIPKKPRKTNTYRENPMGIVGIAKSGAFFYNHKSAEPTCNLAAITEKPTFDTCDGHPDPGCHYHYHKAPVCIPGFDKCGLLGYNNDGVGVYGKCNLTMNGQQVVMKSCYKKIIGKNGCDASHYMFDKMTPGCNLDEANGFSFSTTTQSNGAVFTAGTYAYFFTPDYPFIMPGYYGDRSLVQWCVINI